ncbi:5351_t:CDS:2 [Acaulospora morrowiae]|uniref:5351_t:CDS:1 n=1 Tax=Acaulospora morrowiae TaxID=94023 RepID=A0A9N8ZWN8_9GLOM|nr:5351_t:CDS:2 [Acaulospora morrowiae]
MTLMEKLEKWKKVEETESKFNEKKTETGKSLDSPSEKIKRKDTTLSRESKTPRNSSSSSDQSVKVGNKKSLNITNKSDDKDIVNSVSPTPLAGGNGSVSTPPINQNIEPISSYPNDVSLSSSPFKPLNVGIQAEAVQIQWSIVTSLIQISRYRYPHRQLPSGYHKVANNHQRGLFVKEEIHSPR